MKKSNRVYCDLCKAELVRDNGDDGMDPHGFDWQIAHAHVCHECWEAAVHQAWKERNPCGECETKPCKRWRDCWFEPQIGLPYETYFGERIQVAAEAGEANDGSVD